MTGSPTGSRDLRDVAVGVLLGTFVGDALGARWEGAPPATLDQGRDRLALSLEADELTYTDDTQLTLALAEHLCDHPTVHPPGLVRTFLDHFEDWRGYAMGMHGIVAAWRRGVSPDEAATSVFADGSFGNGAAMRVAPVGVVWTCESGDLVPAARRQAALTHAHPVGMDAAVVQAFAVAAAAAAGAFTAQLLAEVASVAATEEVRGALAPAVRLAASGIPSEGPAEAAAQIGTDVAAHRSVAAALWVAAVSPDLEGAVELSLALGGDVDTIAAMACAVRGAASAGSDLPDGWVAKLEDGPRGRSYARHLATRLAQTGARQENRPPGANPAG